MTVPAWGMRAGAALASIVVAWSFAATGMLLFQDHWPHAGHEQTTSVVETYENRIDSLRAQVEQLKTRSMVEHSSLDEKVEQLLVRQASIESRESVIRSLDGLAESIGLRESQPAVSGDEAAVVDEQAPLDTVTISPSRGKQASMWGGSETPEKTKASDGKLSRVEQSIAAIESRQHGSIAELEAKAKEKAARIRDAFAAIGLDPAKLADGKGSSIGGPFIPYRADGDLSAFEKRVRDAHQALLEVEKLKQAADGVPLRRPFPSAAITSGFGARSDPFLGIMAMHAGIDFRETYGAPVRATAAGVVTEAGWAGGYGNMVEVDHGNGLTTRYGHMSEISVKVGDKIARGDKLGEVGSTGRSTGPHLHYETRIDGEAVDPVRFLRAGKAIDG